MMTENRHRFLCAIGGRLPADAVAELRLFPSIRQGPIESGVAVVAAEQAALAAALPPADAAAPSPADDAASPMVASDAASPANPAPGTGEPRAGDAPAAPEPAASRHPARLSILTARYRLMLKGPDRGRWEFDLVHDADAPLETLDQVVRGVARRVGEEGEPDLLTGAEFSRTIAEPWWNAAT